MKLPFRKKKSKIYNEVIFKYPLKADQKFLKKEQVNGFGKLLNKNSSETEIDNYLKNNPEIFTSLLHNYRIGHDDTLIIPQQTIRPKIKSINQKGLIPDYLIGGNNSNGWEWWVIELKGSQQNIFTKKNNEIYLSPEINKGICQLLSYVDFCNENQANLRDSFKLTNFREPNGILIAGRESELDNDSDKKKMKGAWNRVSNRKLEIRTYDWILRNLNHMLKLNGEL